jgi:2-polyprenyl-3-methyl-5-hydroxy-6-metoxy-1,4-benzoquinol methylase
MLLNATAAARLRPGCNDLPACSGPAATVLDLACGSGRHLRWLAAQGFLLTGIDRDAAAWTPLRTHGTGCGGRHRNRPLAPARRAL